MGNAADADDKVLPRIAVRDLGGGSKHMDAGEILLVALIVVVLFTVFVIVFAGYELGQLCGQVIPVAALLGLYAPYRAYVMRGRNPPS